MVLRRTPEPAALIGIWREPVSSMFSDQRSAVADGSDATEKVNDHPFRLFSRKIRRTTFNRKLI